MTDHSDSKEREKLLALVLFQIRVLLASELDPTAKPHVRHAAQLAYAVHNDALAMLEDINFDLAKAHHAIDRVENLVGAPGNTRLNADRFGIGWQP